MPPENPAPLPAGGPSPLGFLSCPQARTTLSRALACQEPPCWLQGGLLTLEEFCKIDHFIRVLLRPENVPGSLTFTVRNRFYQRNVVWNERSSQMGRQETEGHARTHPGLSKLELEIAGRDAWEPGQAMSKPSSLEAARPLAADCSVYILTLALSANASEPCTSCGRSSKGSRAWGPKAAQLSPNKRETILDIPERGQ